MKFSIIIPCYNTAMWLEECLDSVIGQKYKDWEIIVINDGSTDNTSDIIRIYAQRDARIKVINQENQGVSVARNKAIQNAEGEYLMFLDSDDWYKDEMCLEQIAEILGNGNVDIVVFRYQVMRDKNDICEQYRLQYFEKMKGHTYTGEEYLRSVLYEEKVYQWFPWLYAFRKELWIKNEFQFNKRLWILEDMDIIYQVILKAQRVKVMDRVVYQYRIRKGAATQVKSKKAMLDEINVSVNNINLVSNMDIDEDLRKLLYSNFSYIFFEILREVNYLGKSDRKDIYKVLNQNRDLMNYTLRKQNIFVRRLTYVLGLHTTARLLLMRQKIKNRMEKRRKGVCGK